MADSLTLYEIPPSPNNIRVRLALNYKGLPFESRPVHPADRSEVIEVSGQPLTPVLKHGDRVVFDSASILRYLDANFRQGPRLFSADSNEMRAIEEWEQFGRYELVEPGRTVIRQFRAGEYNPEELSRTSGLLNRLTGRIEDRLNGRHWLVGDRMSAADITVAPVVFLGMLRPDIAGRSPLTKFLFENFDLGLGRDRTREWVERVMAYDL